MGARAARARARVRGLLLALAPRIYLRHACRRGRRPAGSALGLAGEELAARHLRRRGWRLRGRRVATPCGEVDLWAWRPGVSACVEVKTGVLALVPRPSGWRARGPAAGGGRAALWWDLRWRPGLRVDQRRVRRLLCSARFLAGAAGGAPRVDLIEVLVAEGGRRVQLIHHEDLRRRPFARP